ASKNTRLWPSVLDKPINIDTGMVILAERAIRDKIGKVFCSLFIDSIFVRVSAFGQVNFGANNVQKALGLSTRQFPGFICIYNVVWNTGNLFNILRRGSPCFKRMEVGHRGEIW